MAEYDPQILQTFANKLYARANGITASWTVVGAIVGGVAGVAVHVALESRSPVSIAVAASVLSGVAGYVIGSSRAFVLKLQAQQALCQRQIELNTRPKLDSRVPPPLP